MRVPARSFWSRPAAALALLSSVVFLALPVSAQVPTVERDALIALYNSTNGAGWGNNSEWLGAAATECTWFGVACSGGSVYQIDLGSNERSDSIPAELGNLANLHGESLLLVYLSCSKIEFVERRSAGIAEAFRDPAYEECSSSRKELA
jgi:hypothetical protein